MILQGSFTSQQEMEQEKGNRKGQIRKTTPKIYPQIIQSFP